MLNLPDGSLQVLKTLYFNKDQKGLIALDNVRILDNLVFVETVCQGAEPGPSHFASLTEKGRKFCEEKFGRKAV